VAANRGVSTRTIDRAREQDAEFALGEQDRANGPVFFFWLQDIVPYERMRPLRTQRLAAPKRSTETARAGLK
jgi:hypothetical protein